MTWLRKQISQWKVTRSNAARADWLVWSGMLALALLPVINLFYILATTGANNLSNDYAFFIPLIDDILTGGYDWGHFFRDTFFVSHFQPLPVLVYLANACLTGWNIYYELFFIAILSVIRVVLTYQALTVLYPTRLRILVLPVVSMLVFSQSQISSYEFGASAVPLGLTAFGFTLAVWGLVKYNRCWKGFLCMLAGGVIASWTAASGVIAWPIFLILMLLLGLNKRSHLATWLAGTLLINFPYLYFLVINREPGVNAYLQSIFNPRLIANLLGRPFANGIGDTTGYIPLGEAAGWLGVGMGLIGFGLVVARWKSLQRRAAPALMFMIFGLLSAWQTSLYRVMIAPWYTNMVMPYWLGLVGLAYVLAGSAEQRDTARIPGWLSSNVTRWAYPFLSMVIVTGFYLGSNLSYQDKSFYLASRRPVSAACLRSYMSAPTFCERYVFQWSVNRVPLDEFAWPLQSHNLSVFAKQQTWSLQGDVILGKVFSTEVPESSGAMWIDGASGEPALYTDYRRLNLAVTPSFSTTWRVKLPENLQSATLVSASNLQDDRDAMAVEEPVTFEVTLTSPDQTEKLIYTRVADGWDTGWDSFRVPLTGYHGQEVMIHFAVKGGLEAGVALYRYPIIHLSLLPTTVADAPPIIQPLNTELSPEAPQAQPDDYVFHIADAQISGMIQETSDTSTWVVQIDPNFHFLLQQPQPVDDYGWVSFRMRASPKISSLAAEIFLFMEGQEQYFYIVMPLLMDGEMHTYTYPLRLLDATGKLAALRLDPIMFTPASEGNLVTVEDVRLIRRP